MVETGITIVCLLLILNMGKAGAGFGLFFEMTSTLLVGFALLVALRYWYPFTQVLSSIVPVSGAYACFVAYWVLFLIGCIPLLVVMKLVNEDSRPTYPGFLDGILGFVFGAASTTLFVCAVMTSLSVIIPKIWSDYEPSALFVRFDLKPIEMYQHIESNWMGISTNNPSHTRLPTLDKEDLKKAEEGGFEKYWQ